MRNNKLAPHQSIGGLSIFRKVGEVISINNAEVLIQVTECGLGHCRLTIRCDRERYTIDRLPAPGRIEKNPRAT